jgi:hypothetical protein
VRVTNVDPQTSGENIVVQVIGGISNKAQLYLEILRRRQRASLENGSPCFKLRYTENSILAEECRTDVVNPLARQANVD